MAWHSSLAPVAERSGDRLAIAFGVTEPLTTRLARIHSPLEARDFRMAQVAWSLAAGAGTALVTIILGTAPVLTLAASIAATLVSFLSIEQRLATRSETWRRRIFLELPVVSEQLGMLLSAGHSLGQALTRIARRSDAAISRDLSVVVGRLQQGVEEAAALREWSELAGVPALDRLLSVLALNREATDLGSLITEEARATRAEVHRELIEQLERRAQQVWIPVTVATLIPGVLFLAVPFLEALRLFSST
jgi:Flp pilus assembly protein TadB